MPRLVHIKPESDQAQPVERLALRRKEAAIALGICERTLCTLTKAGQVPSFTLGGSIMYPVEQLREWMRTQCDKTQPATKPAA